VAEEAARNDEELKGMLFGGVEVVVRPGEVGEAEELPNPYREALRAHAGKPCVDVAIEGVASWTGSIMISFYGMDCGGVDDEHVTA
jgi:hypothetical protein